MLSRASEEIFDVYNRDIHQIRGQFVEGHISFVAKQQQRGLATYFGKLCDRERQVVQTPELRLIMPNNCYPVEIEDDIAVSLSRSTSR